MPSSAILLPECLALKELCLSTPSPPWSAHLLSRVYYSVVIQPAGASATWLCGLYRMEDKFPVFTVLTKEPTEDLRRIHDRMPVMLPKDMIRDWINPKNKPEELLPHALTDMVFDKSG